ncbi:MAG: hypothetical protein HY820_34960 [Acidobacteria bacterium]|nr:hypothetical protein [Acidobacteriota bacterium]
MEDAGQKLKKVRERLDLRYRDVEEASNKIADHHQNDEFALGLSRLADIENKGVVPTLYRLYSLCAIYRLDPIEVMSWYGVKVTELPSDSARIDIEKTHLIEYNPPSGAGSVTVPLALDPGLDLRKTTYLSRMIQRWGKLPLMLLDNLDLEDHRYGYVGTDDWFMYPILQPGALVLIDETKRRILNTGWSNEYDRPIYFLETEEGYFCGWCHLSESGQIVMQPHPAALSNPVFFERGQADVIGQVVGVAMRLDHSRKRRARSSTG